jgi:ribonuclease T2
VIRALLAFVVACVLAAPALAQERRGAPAGSFDFYVLALSWSPGWCTVEGDAKNRNQCETGSGKGFVVHGLWPQYERGFPAFCEPGSRSAPSFSLDRAANVFPERGLAQYQWRKHGTCSGLSPTDYFRAVEAAKSLVKVPAVFDGLKDEMRLAPLEIERAFAGINRGLRPDAMSVQCERSILEEVRICRDLKSFIACAEVDRRRCGASEVKIPPVR